MRCFCHAATAKLHILFKLTKISQLFLIFFGLFWMMFPTKLLFL